MVIHAFFSSVDVGFTFVSLVLPRVFLGLVVNLEFLFFMLVFYFSKSIQ
jgi:hypothetical protein